MRRETYSIFEKKRKKCFLPFLKVKKIYEYLESRIYK